MIFKPFIFLLVISASSPKPSLEVFQGEKQFATKEECTTTVETDLKNVLERLKGDDSVKVVGSKGQCMTDEEFQKLVNGASKEEGKI